MLARCHCFVDYHRRIGSCIFISAPDVTVFIAAQHLKKVSCSEKMIQSIEHLIIVTLPLLYSMSKPTDERVIAAFSLS